MVRGVPAFGFAYLCFSFAALELFTFLDSQYGAGTGTTTSAEAPLLYSVAEVLPPLAAVVVLFVAVTLTFRYLMSRHVAAATAPVDGAGNGRRSVSGLVMLLLCVSAGTLEFIVFGKAAGAGGGGADQGGLALAALRALPTAATATFFLGMMLIIVAHVRAGGEGGGGAVAGDGPIQALLRRLLTKVAAGAAATLVGLIAMALTLYNANGICRCAINVCVGFCLGMGLFLSIYRLTLGSNQLSLKSILWEDLMQVAIKA